MPGGVLEIVGTLALLIGCAELVSRLLPRRLADENDAINRRFASPQAEPEVQRLRESGL